MEFTVRKFDLLQELTLIQGVVERKTTIPILANVLVRAEGGELGIVATDLEIGLKSVCVSKTTVPGTMTLPAKRLYEIVRPFRTRRSNSSVAKQTGSLSPADRADSGSQGCLRKTFRHCPKPKAVIAQIPAEVLVKTDHPDHLCDQYRRFEVHA